LSGPPKILLVEDQVLIALGLTELLHETGHEVVGVAATVSDALVVAANTKPDVAVVDVRLGGRQDGIEGAQLLQEQFGVPVVFLTAQTDLETKDRAAAVNAVVFLQKPVHPERLVRAIQTAVREKGPFGTNRAD
jgi:two-component system, response regulator PdtaR